MARISPKTTWKLAKAIKGRRKHETAKSGSAKVSKVDGSGTVWVRPLGASVDVPVNGSSVARVKVGDTVTYETGDGRLKVTGNSTDPAVGAEGAKVVANDVVMEATKPIVKRVADVSDTAQKAAAAAKDITDAIGQFFWHDTSGAHVSTEEGNPDAAQNTIWNSLGMLFRKGTYNVLAVVTGQDPGIDVYDGTGNAGSNILAALHGSGLMLGRSTESHMEIDYHSMSMTDSGGTEYLRVSDLRDRTGYATVKHPFYGDGTTRDFKVSMPATSTESVTVDGVAASYTYSNQTYRLTTAPADGALVLITYKTNVNWAKAFTFGTRNSDYDPATGESYSAVGPYSAVFGSECIADGYCSFAAGRDAYAHGQSSVALGEAAKAYDGAFAAVGGTADHGSVAFGGDATGGTCFAACSAYNKAKGLASSVFGHGTIASGDYQTALGAWNEEDTSGDFAFIVGNGADEENRSNAFTVDWNGIIGAGASETQVAISSYVRTVTHNVVHSNGVCCSITLNVRNGAAISSGGHIAVGTVPDGYRPAYTVYEACSSGTAGGMDCYMSLSSAGAITVYNRSSTSLAANSVLAATLTFAL